MRGMCLLLFRVSIMEVRRVKKKKKRTRKEKLRKSTGVLTSPFSLSFVLQGGGYM